MEKSSNLTGESTRGKELQTFLLLHRSSGCTRPRSWTAHQPPVSLAGPPRCIKHPPELHRTGYFDWAGLNPAHFPKGMFCIFLFTTDRGTFSPLPELLQPLRRNEAPFRSTETWAIWDLPTGDWDPSVILCSVLCPCCQHYCLLRRFSLVLTWMPHCWS